MTRAEFKSRSPGRQFRQCRPDLPQAELLRLLGRIRASWRVCSRLRQLAAHETRGSSWFATRLRIQLLSKASGELSHAGGSQ